MLPIAASNKTTAAPCPPINEVAVRAGSANLTSCSQSTGSLPIWANK